MPSLEPVTQQMLLGASVMMAISALMVFLCLVLKANVDRWLNIVLGVVYTIIVLLTMPGAWAFYLFLGCTSCFPC